MVESTALEMRHTGNRIGGSNPSLSASVVRTVNMGQMSLRALLIAAGVGWGAGATTAHAAASACPDPGAVCNVQCYDASCSVWRACWVTETGIGVCSPVRYGRARRVIRN